MLYRLAWREWFNRPVYPVLFMLSLILALTAYLTLDNLQLGVENYISDNQKQMVGGDLVVQSRQAFPDSIKQAVEQLSEKDIVYDYQFNAIAYTEENSLLARVKSVTAAYPLYGQVELKSGRDLQSAWEPGEIIVESQVLSGLQVKVGDSIRIGESLFRICDELISEPDRPLTAFGFGARILMRAEDMLLTGLVGQRSRVNYRLEIKLPDEQLIDWKNKLTELVEDTRIQVETVSQMQTSISLLSANFLRFLKLLVVAVIILSGIGLSSVVGSFLANQHHIIAIRRTLGETGNTVVLSYRLVLFIMTFIGVGIAVLLSILVIHLGGDVFKSILPKNIYLGLGMWSIVKTIGIALILVFLITVSALRRVREIKPLAILHQHQMTSTAISAYGYLIWIGGLISAWGFLYLEMGNMLQALQILFAAIILWTVLYIINHWILRWLANHVPDNWLLRLGMQNIFRKGAHSKLFINAMSLTIMLLSLISLLDYSINDQLIDNYPEDSPNFFLLDVQPQQQSELDEMMPAKLTYYPVVRARIDTVNGVSAESLKDQLGHYDNITRVFNLSYSNTVLKTERIKDSISDGALFNSKLPTSVVSLSILASIAEYLQVEIGDRIVFNIQGVPLEAQITSIRERLKRGPSPFFYFIFPPDVLREAPQIRFATTWLKDEERVRLQTEIAQRFPGITTLDGNSIAKQLKYFVDQLKQLVQIFTGLSLFAGFLILLASMLATSQDRYRESSYYRLMGMLSHDLYRLSIVEFLFLGMIALLMGVILGSIISWLLVTYWFSVQFVFPWYLFTVFSIGFIVKMMLIGIIYTYRVLRSQPLDYVRSETH